MSIARAKISHIIFASFNWKFVERKVERPLAEEINVFLKANGCAKVRLIQAGYQAPLGQKS